MRHDTRRQLSPDGYSVQDILCRPGDPAGDLVLVLTHTRDDVVAVYRCDPHTGQGKFVVERLKP